MLAGSGSHSICIHVYAACRSSQGHWSFRDHMATSVKALWLLSLRTIPAHMDKEEARSQAESFLWSLLLGLRLVQIQSSRPQTPASHMTLLTGIC